MKPVGWSLALLLAGCWGEIGELDEPAPVTGAATPAPAAVEAVRVERPYAGEPLGCPEPRPPREQLQLNAHPHNRWVDSTPIVTRACEYCAAIGLGTYPGGIPRCSCPMRAELPEGSGPNDERVACELYVLGGPPVWQAMPAGVPRVNPDNFFQAGCAGDGCQAVRVCNADATVCSAWVEPP
jgi:hypothetical protein